MAALFVARKQVPEKAAQEVWVRVAGRCDEDLGGALGNKDSCPSENVERSESRRSHG